LRHARPLPRAANRPPPTSIGSDRFTGSSPLPLTDLVSSPPPSIHPPQGFTSGSSFTVWCYPTICSASAVPEDLRWCSPHSLCLIPVQGDRSGGRCFPWPRTSMSNPVQDQEGTEQPQRFVKFTFSSMQAAVDHREWQFGNGQHLLNQLSTRWRSFIIFARFGKSRCTNLEDGATRSRIQDVLPGQLN
ncbi:hypothetical protein EJB05_31558, partial [Eragrostis curvula]